MGNRLFGVDISGAIKKHVGPGVLAATLERRAPGTRTTGALTAGTQPTSTTHTARGYTEEYAEGQIDGTRVRVGDRIVALVGDSITPYVIPRPEDSVTISGRTYKIVRVTADPANAVFRCQARGRP